MRGFGVHLSKAEVDELFKLFDADHSGSVSYDEFLKVSHLILEYAYGS